MSNIHAKQQSLNEEMTKNIKEMTLKISSNENEIEKLKKKIKELEA